MALPQPTGSVHRIALDVIRDFPPSALFDFNTKTSDAEFLFESEVVEYLAQIRKRAVHMQAAERIFEPLPVGDERSRHVQAAHDDRLWLTEQGTAMTKIFAPT